MKTFMTLLLLVPFLSYAFSSKSEQATVKKEQAAAALPLKSLVLKKSVQKVILKNKSFEKEAIEDAFIFLDKNATKLQGDSLCLKKDNIRNRNRIRNQKCMVIADYTKSKKTPRLLIVNPQTGESELFYTAHGKGSHNKGEIETGHVAKRFSNVSGSNMTSLGFYLTDNIYNSQKSTFGPGPANGLKMDGINCTNNNARMRYIVMHTADYVQPLSGEPKKIGNSEGCVTVPEHRKDILQKCKGGALVYAYYKKQGKIKK